MEGPPERDFVEDDALRGREDEADRKEEKFNNERDEPPLYRYWLRIEDTQLPRKKLPESLALGDDSQSILHEEFSIGREKENTSVLTLCAAIRLPEVEVSKAHARIMRDSIFFRSSYCLLDMGSRNGTFVNGQRLSTNVHTLKPGDQITIGSTTLVLERAPLPPPTRPVTELPRKSFSQLKRAYRETKAERDDQARREALYVDRAASRRADNEGAFAQPAPEEVAVPALPRHNVGYRMLSSMGWQVGTGLGASGEGRQTPVQTDSQRGRSGLGFDSAKRGKSS